MVVQHAHGERALFRQRGAERHRCLAAPSRRRPPLAVLVTGGAAPFLAMGDLAGLAEQRRSARMDGKLGLQSFFQ
jgi:hypothetical protein